MAVPTPPFASITELKQFINAYIRNSAIEGFQNLRLNTILNESLRILEEVDTGGGGGGGGDTNSFTGNFDS